MAQQDEREVTRESDAKPDLLIDVDGVVFGQFGGYSQLRPDVVQFLRWCAEHFNCYWLTAWPKKRLDILFTCLMAPDLKCIKEATRTYGPHGKAGDIDYSRPFFWIEDSLLAEERAYLYEQGAEDRYIYVNPEGRDELEHTWQMLREKIGE